MMPITIPTMADTSTSDGQWRSAMTRVVAIEVAASSITTLSATDRQPTSAAPAIANAEIV